MSDPVGRPVRFMSVDISYDDDQHPRHQRLEWTSEVRPTFLTTEQHAGWPKMEQGSVVLTVSKYPTAQYGGPVAFDALPIEHKADTTEPFEFCENADGTPLTLEELLGQALGAASMCWSEPPAGVFASERASKIVDALFDRVTRWAEP